jgi:hypothetical protein
MLSTNLMETLMKKLNTLTFSASALALVLAAPAFAAVKGTSSPMTAAQIAPTIPVNHPETNGGT